MLSTVKAEKFIPHWQRSLQEAITDPLELLTLLELPLELLEGARISARSFKLRVPRGFVANMEKKNPRDPLLLQVLPLLTEMEEVPRFIPDPLQEAVPHATPGLLHKYEGRILLTATGACAIHCRYCFRRHFPYEANNPSKKYWEEALAYIAEDPSIKEVILSGGDPLLMNDTQLADFIEPLEKIPHVTTLRFHTRVPIVLPERITPEWIHLLKNTRLQIVIVTHCNHPRECDEAVKAAMDLLRDANFTLLNQSVLLKDVNDTVETLRALSERLFEVGILPYYLHLLDPVKGSHHFEVSDETAIALMNDLVKTLPGYLVPKLVRETPGELSKTWIAF